jgi:tripartite-type tricarboxylate transporter receptor subunit TctC
MILPRRRFLQLAAGAVALPAVARSAAADTYPSRPVRIVVGFPGGAATDIVARLISDPLSQRLGQQVIIDNRAGAGSNLGADVAAHAAPDGYTLLAMTVTNAVNATLYRDQGLNFDIVRDLAPVIGTFRSPLVMVVTPSLPAKTLAEFIAYAKANPGKVNYASLGIGSAPHINGELFKMMAGVDLVHVPYKSNPMADLLGGQVQMFFSPVPLVIGYIKAGTVRALAVSGAERVAALPDVPTVAEVVPGYETYIWHGIAAPKSTPADIIEKLNTEINAVLATPKIKEEFTTQGGAPIGGSPADLAKLIATEIDKWGKVIRTANIKPE